MEDYNINLNTLKKKGEKMEPKEIINQLEKLLNYLQLLEMPIPQAIKEALNYIKEKEK